MYIKKCKNYDYFYDYFDYFYIKKCKYYDYFYI